MMEKTVSEWIVDVCLEHGVDTVFGLPGGLISPLYAALAGTEIRLVTTKHESCAVLAAIGYALATGRPGVVLVTAGPGVTNAITGVATAMTERVPLVIFGGEVPRSAFGRGALQEGSTHTFDAVGMMAKVTKMSVQLVRTDAAVPTVRGAFATAQRDVPGPVFLSLPVDTGAAMTRTSQVQGKSTHALEPEVAACREAFDLLRAASRPLLLAGAGARDGESRRALLRLAEAINSPVTVTPKGKGVFPEDHPLYLGVLGFGGHESVIGYLHDKPDVVMACGTGLNDFSTNAWSPLLQPSQAFIHVEIDPGRFGRNYPTDHCLLGRISEVVSRMLQPGDAPLSDVPRISLVRQHPPRSQTGQISSVDVMSALNELAPRNSIFTADMGEHLAFALHYLSIGAEADFITCLGFGAMGSSIPVGIGLALGCTSRGRRVYVVCGDGGFGLAGLEIETAVRHGAPVTFVVLNDHRLNMCHHGMLDRYGVTNDFATGVIEIGAIAEATGVTGKVIRDVEQLREALRSTREGGTEVLDIRIDPDVRLGGSQRTSALRQFSERPP